MMELSSQTIEQIRTHTYEFPGEEVCGLIVNGNVVRCTNTAQDKSLFFVINPTEYAKVEESFGTVEAVYHSHASDLDDFSVPDIKAAKVMKLPWILCTKTGQIRTYDPNETAPFIGREWRWAFQNCYTLFQDWYKHELSIELADFYLDGPRSWEDGKSVGFLENFEPQGFRRLGAHEAIRRHDVVLMYCSTKVPNHVGVIIDPDKNHLLQHLSDRLSEISVYGGPWQRYTHSIWRHRSLD